MKKKQYLTRSKRFVFFFSFLWGGVDETAFLILFLLIVLEGEWIDPTT